MSTCVSVCAIISKVVERNWEAAELLAKALKVGMQVGTDVLQATAPAGRAQRQRAGGWGRQAFAFFHMVERVGQCVEQQSAVDCLETRIYSRHYPRSTKSYLDDVLRNRVPGWQRRFYFLAHCECSAAIVQACNVE